MREATEEIKAVRGAVASSRADILKRVYGKFASVRTSIYLLGLMAIFTLTGMLFPQGAELSEYIQSGGSLVFLVDALELLDWFSSPAFLFLSFVLFVNLSVCTWQRVNKLGPSTRIPQDITPTHSIKLTQDVTDAFIDVRRVLREELGFRVVAKDESFVIMEKGLSYRWLTWMFHAGMIACFSAFIITYLFAYEGTLKLYTGKATTIKPQTTGRVTALLGSGPSESEFKVMLEEFSTEYTESPSLDYPEDMLSRLAVGLGWLRPEYRLTDRSYSPKDWKSRLTVIKDSKALHAKTIEVNDPLKWGGYTFYQRGHDYRYRVRVNESPILLDVTAGEEFAVPGVDASIRFAALKTGTLHRLDGTVERIKPFTTVKLVMEDGGMDVDLGRVEPGETIPLNGTRITLVDYEEASILSYRYDPAVPLLWIAGILIFITMALRFYGSWYRAIYRIDESAGIVNLDLHITARGLSSDKSRLAGRIEYFLTKDDIKPAPLPEPAE